MIVVDLGCARLGNDYSIERLIEMFHPSILYGFDPQWTSEMLMDFGDTAVVTYAAAAWTYDGWIGFDWNAQPLLSRVLPDDPTPALGGNRAQCVDIARFMESLSEGPVVMKIDVEGGEYELLEHLIATGMTTRISRVLVEWHPRGEGKRRHEIEMALRRDDVVMEQWRW